MATAPVEKLLLELWSRRKESGAIHAVTDKLITLAHEPSVIDEVEFYLPQFGHLVIHLADELPDVAALEKFILAVCQVSTHLVCRALLPRPRFLTTPCGNHPCSTGRP